MFKMFLPFPHHSSLLVTLIVKPINHWNLQQSNYSRLQKHTVKLILLTSDRFSGIAVNYN